MLVSWAGSEHVQYVCMYETVLDNCVCVSDTCSWNTPADSPALPVGSLPVGVQIEEARRTHTEEGGREERERITKVTI